MTSADLLAFVFECATRDQQALLDAYVHCGGPEVGRIQKRLAQIEALRVKLLPGRSPRDIRALIMGRGAKPVSIKEIKRRARKKT